MAEEKTSILPGPFSNLKDFNLGIILVSIYILFDFGGFQGLYPFVTEFRLPYILATSSVIYSLFLVFTGRVDFSSHTTKIFFVLTLYVMGYTWLRTENPQAVHDYVRQFLHFLSNYLIIVSCVKKPSQFILLIDIWLFAIIHSSFHTIMQGGKLYANIWLKDENHISIIAAYAIPFALTLFMSYRSLLKKTCYAIGLAFYVAVVVVAASRGGALAMASVGFLCWLLYKHKIRNLLVILVAVVLVFSYAPKRFFSEMETLKEGTKEGTADDRIYLWGIALRMFGDYPILGVGPMNYPNYFIKYDKESRYDRRFYVKGRAKVAHSTPLQWMAEMGILGSIILLLLQVSMYKNWGMVRKYKTNFPEASIKETDFRIFESLTHANAIAQVGFWVAAIFLTLQPYPFYWILVPFSEAWKNIVVARIKTAPDSRSGAAHDIQDPYRPKHFVHRDK